MAFEEPLRKSSASAKQANPLSQPLGGKQKKPSLFDDEDEDLIKPTSIVATKVVVQDKVERAYVEEKKQIDPNSIFKIDRAKATALFGDFGDEDEAETAKSNPVGPKTSAPSAATKKPSLFDDDEEAPLTKPSLHTVGDATKHNPLAAAREPEPSDENLHESEETTSTPVNPVAIVAVADSSLHKKEGKKKKQNLLFGDDESDEDALESAVESAPTQPRRKQISIFDDEDEEEVARKNRTLQGVFIPTGALLEQPEGVEPIAQPDDDSLREIEETTPAIDMKEIERLASLELEKEERERYRKEHKTTIKAETKPAPSNVVLEDDDDLFSMVSTKPKAGSSAIDSFNISAYIQQNSSVSSKGLFD